MIVNGKTTIVINGKQTRVCSHVFNRAFRQACNRDQTSRPGSFVVLTVDGKRLAPPKDEGWGFVAKRIRAGKSIQARAQ